MNETRQSSPAELKQEILKLTDILNTKDTNKLGFGLAVVGFESPDRGNTEVNAVLGGPPQALTTVLMELEDSIVAQNPEAANIFLLHALARAKKNRDIEDLIDKAITKAKQGALH